MGKFDGGPAFPREDYQSIDAPGQRGMSLRDYFAAHAPPAPAWWFEDYESALRDLDMFAQHEAQWRMAYADAMIAEGTK